MNAYETALTLSNMAREGRDGTIDATVLKDTHVEEKVPLLGYYVGGVRPGLVVSDVSELDRGDLAWFVGTTNARFFGVWKDTETGDIYFDAVTWITGLGEALYVAAERGEIAIWDIQNGEEIRVKEANA